MLPRTIASDKENVDYDQQKNYKTQRWCKKNYVNSDSFKATLFKLQRLFNTIQCNAK